MCVVSFFNIYCIDNNVVVENDIINQFSNIMSFSNQCCVHCDYYIRTRIYGKFMIRELLRIIVTVLNDCELTFARFRNRIFGALERCYHSIAY